MGEMENAGTHIQLFFPGYAFCSHTRRYFHRILPYTHQENDPEPSRGIIAAQTVPDRGKVLEAF